MNVRYRVIPDKVGHGVMILDTETGSVQYPACWQDISAYYYYLVNLGRIDQAQDLLAESMAGHKPITSMVTGMANVPSHSRGYR